MKILGQVFLDHLNVGVVHFVKASAFFLPVFDINPEDLEFGCLSRPCLPTANEGLFNLPIEFLSLFNHQGEDTLLPFLVFGLQCNHLASRFLHLLF